MLNIAGAAAPAELRGCTPVMMRATQPVIIANGGNPLIGFKPSTGARSGFNTQFYLPYASAAAFLNGVLNTAGVDITLQFGTAGGVKVATNLLETLTIQGSEGGIIDCNGTFMSRNKPQTGQTATPGTFGEVFGFEDVTSFMGVAGIARLLVNQFSFKITRKLIPYHGNSKTGIAQRLGVGHTEVDVNCEYLKGDDTEGAAALADCPPTHDVVLLLTSVCSGEILRLTQTSGFYDEYPQSVGGTEEYIRERAVSKATTGAFAIAAA